MSYVAAQRTGEMGIRMALGARPGELLWLVMRESMTPVMAGIGVGLATAVGATRPVSSQLFGSGATHPVTTPGRTLLTRAAAGLAVCISGRRARRARRS